MKQTIYIKKLIARSKTKPEASIDFINGLNVIEGRSDTGKSCIQRCIDYCFGAKDKPFEENVVNYNEVEIIIATSNGDVKLKRSLTDKSKIFISFELNPDSNKYYKIKNSDKTSFNDIMFNCIGINERHTIIKNQNYDYKSLTWRTIYSLFNIDSKRIEEEKSIIFPKERTAITPLLSALNFLITGNDLANKDSIIKKEIKDAQKEAIKLFANNQISINNEEKLELEKKLNILNEKNTETTLKNKLNELQITENQIQNLIKKNNIYLEKIQNLQDDIIKSKILLDRYYNLESQYNADIKRLSFIVEGEINMSKIHDVTKCPFCNNDIPKSNQESYIDLSKNELNIIILQSKDLQETINTLKNELDDKEKELNENIHKKKDNDKILSDTLNPKVKELKTFIEDVNDLIKLKSKYESFNNFSKQLSESIKKEIDNIDKKNNRDKKYKPIDYLADTFLKEMNNNIRDILQYCKYDNNNAINFNLNKLDIEINGNPKKLVYGQGYTSFLNTVVILALRKFLNEKANYTTGFFIIDSPLASLDQSNINQDLNEALYKYMIENQQYSQLIIFENTKNIPDLSKYKNKYNHITFTGEKNNGRYGFLYDTYNQEINK